MFVSHVFLIVHFWRRLFLLLFHRVPNWLLLVKKKVRRCYASTGDALVDTTYRFCYGMKKDVQTCGKEHLPCRSMQPRRSRGAITHRPVKPSSTSTHRMRHHHSRRFVFTCWDLSPLSMLT